MSLSIYTDGSFSSSENMGGFGVIVFDNSNNHLIFAHQEQFENVTNNQMELKAIIYAFDFCFKFFPEEEVIIYTDSNYCARAVNDWSRAWAANGWINSKNETVKNLELIKTLYNYNTIKNEKNQIKVEWLRGHSSSIGNELADGAATMNKNKILNIIKENHIKVEKFDIFN